MNPFKQKRDLLRSLRGINGKDLPVACPRCAVKTQKSALAESGAWHCRSAGRFTPPLWSLQARHWRESLLTSLLARWNFPCCSTLWAG